MNLIVAIKWRDVRIQFIIYFNNNQTLDTHPCSLPIGRMSKENQSTEADLPVPEDISGSLPLQVEPSVLQKRCVENANPGKCASLSRARERHYLDER